MQYIDHIIRILLSYNMQFSREKKTLNCSKGAILEGITVSDKKKAILVGILRSYY